MGKIQDRQKIVNEIIAAAQVYKNNLIGNAYLYIFENKHIEVVYRKREFLHLTGVDTKMGSEEFYKEAVRGTLKPNQISFSARHPYDLCEKKMSQIGNICAVTNSDLLILEDMTTETLVYKFGITELNFTVGLSYDLDKSGNKKSNMFIARTLRTEDSFSRGTTPYEVDFILKKKNDERFYSEITFADERKKLRNVSDDIKRLIAPGLLADHKDN